MWMPTTRRPKPKLKPRKAKRRPRIDVQLKSAMRYVENALPVWVAIKRAEAHRGQDHSGDDAVFVTVYLSSTVFEKIRKHKSFSLTNISILVSDIMYDEGVNEYVYINFRVE